jgi:predicted site-specific integrase-resolvase
MNTTSQSVFPTDRPIVSLSKFCEQAGITATTAWRWRRKGWLTTVNIAGRQYVTGEAVSDFLRRAEAGEFAQEHKTPSRSRKTGV